MKRSYILLITALALGLTWALRGHFGHEYGAAWAGSIGAMALIIATRRKDWLQNLPAIALLAGLGWGVGGMMSYGIVVGYGRSTDFFNAWYGLVMLGVIGGLYGYIGGGLLGLGLETRKDHKPNWATLIAEMVAIGLLVWAIIIYQFEWNMTPPRSEAWAMTLGAALALAWYCQRNGFGNALVVAGYSALGAGFGFAFGNFLQVLGATSGISFNWWNVMEFSLGFFGGLGMAYGVTRRQWPEIPPLSKRVNMWALIGMVGILPGINIIHAFHWNRLVNMAEQLQKTDISGFVMGQRILGWDIVVISTIIAVILWKRYEKQTEKNPEYLFTMFLITSIAYILMSHIVTGFFYGMTGLNHYLYWVVLFITLLIWKIKGKAEIYEFEHYPKETALRWGIIIPVMIAIIAILALIAISVHGELPGSHNRF